jgi:hypothetical protein
MSIKSREQELHEKIIEVELEAINSCRRAAAQSLFGSGVEFGAGDRPWPLPKAIDITYFDDEEILKTYFPNEKANNLNAKEIKKLGQETQDFIIGAHLIEHLEDPLGWLLDCFWCLKKNGKLLLAVPNKQKTFDIERKLTSYEHLIRDQLSSGASSKKEHVIEHHTLLTPRPEFEDRKLTLQELREKVEIDEKNPRLNIHFHVFDLLSFGDILEKFKSQFDFEVDLIIPVVNEIIVLLRKL